MNTALAGGTVEDGAGQALRGPQAVLSIMIGSRDVDRDNTKAAALRERSHKLTIIGHTNLEAAELGEIVVVALPANGLASTLPELRPATRGKVVVSTVVPLTFGGPRLFTPPAAGSSAEEIQALLPEARVVAAFHHIAAHELAEADHPLECDLLICGQDAGAKETVDRKSVV